MSRSAWLLLLVVGLSMANRNTEDRLREIDRQLTELQGKTTALEENKAGETVVIALTMIMVVISGLACCAGIGVVFLCFGIRNLSNRIKKVKETTKKKASTPDDGGGTTEENTLAPQLP
ncbi:unnamed protein product, partial [Mesorhabditis spiculigera]